MNNKTIPLLPSTSFLLYCNVRKFMWGRVPHIFTEQGPIGFKSGPGIYNPNVRH